MKHLTFTSLNPKNYIRISNGYIINRNTGEYKNSKGEVICQFKVINFIDLPKVNDEGKLF